MKRRMALVVLVVLSCLATACGGGPRPHAEVAPVAPKKQRVILLMLDGLGIQYLRSTELPEFAHLEREGFYKEVRALMPTVTNANNASICSGVFPDQHGITGNSYLTQAGVESYMESADLLLAPTLFERAGKFGVHSALLSSKKKTIGLLARGTDVAMSPETADASWVERLGPPPHIYSREVNYWLMDAALDVLVNRPDITLLYVHTTDYPMHTWPPEAEESKQHLRKIDEYLGHIRRVAPDAMLLITADHDVNHKTGVWDLERALAAQKTPMRIAISAEKDKYPKHHKGYGGVSYVYLNAAQDAAAVTSSLRALAGVKEVLTRREAAARFHLLAERIGDLVVLGDAVTVFGNLESAEFEALPAEYRTHGSESELPIPLFVYNAPNLPGPDFFEFNKDLAAWLYR